MKFGLSPKILRYLIDTFKDLKEIDSVIIFGSRALGNYKPGSDVDLALIGPALDEKIVLTVSKRLNQELPLPYYFDIVAYGSIKSQALIDHINKYGITIYLQSEVEGGEN